MNETKQFAACEDCDNIVYRIPGKRHGDGQLDTDDSPVWLLSDVYGFADHYRGSASAASISDLARVHCGCVEVSAI